MAVGLACGFPNGRGILTIRVATAARLGNDSPLPTAYISAMRFIGKITTWHENRGFGFISPDEGGQDIFVHISELPRGFGPSPDKALSFELAVNPQGKKKAVRVQQVKLPPAPATRAKRFPDRRSNRTTARGMRRTYVVGPVLFVLILVSAYRWNEQRAPALIQALPPSVVSEPPALAPSTQRCDGRTMCSQMTSCVEATYFLKNCPGTKMDGNNDGVPCEMQWCK